MAGTMWTNFTPGTAASATAANQNFDWLEADILPMIAGVTTDNQHNLGSNLYTWRGLYFSNQITLAGTAWKFNLDANTMGLSGSEIIVNGVRGTTANSGGTAREISQGTISTPDLLPDSATTKRRNVDASTTQVYSTTAAVVSLTTMAGEVSAGSSEDSLTKRILICGHITFAMTVNSGAFRNDVRMSVSRGSTVVKNTFGICLRRLNATGSELYSMSFFGFDAVTAGTFTWNICYSTAAGEGVVTSIPHYSLIALELRA